MRVKHRRNLLILVGFLAILIYFYTAFVHVKTEEETEYGIPKTLFKFSKTAESPKGGTEYVQRKRQPLPTLGYHSDPLPGYENLSYRELRNNPVPNTIHYVWCHDRTISFEHYLSILSAWKLMRPDSIEFHSIYHFNTTEKKYDMWMTELKRTVAGFAIHKIPDSWDGQENGCGVWFGIAVLDDRGGIYFSENLLLMKSISSYRQHNFKLGLNKHGDEMSFIFAKEKDKSLRELVRMKRKQDLSPNSFNDTVVCEIIPKGKVLNIPEDIECCEISNIHPVDIMYSNTTLAARARQVFYGDSAIVKDTPKLPGKIPKIVHLVWYREKEMDFMMYLSLRSVMTILKPEKVFIHGDNLLHGKYFDKFKRDPRLHTVYREVPDTIFGHKVLYTQHKSDIIRADVLLKYGGIYMDWDVLWLKPIDDLIDKGYDAIFNFDHMTRNGYPDVINLGVFLAKQHSHFVKFWQDSLVNYRSEDFYHNALELPYKTYEKYPQYVHVERHLQVMCFQLKCHPTFRNHYHEFDREQYFDWKKEAYAIHFTHPDPPEYANESALKQGYNKFAEIGQHILNQKYEYD
ncbi:uncharacterized protein LOC134231727 [Saccostrea cucullata]|uniref:uncharacterized protein LOC134231727 n=1 Tax=Saccostrea cuccullata TaxID=36930 RepID=UPI002ED221D6